MSFHVFYLEETISGIFMGIATYMSKDKYLRRANRVLGDQKKKKNAGGISPCPGAHWGDRSFWTGSCSLAITNLNLLLRREAERMLKRVSAQGNWQTPQPRCHHALISFFSLWRGETTLEKKCESSCFSRMESLSFSLQLAFLLAQPATQRAGRSQAES